MSGSGRAMAPGFTLIELLAAIVLLVTLVSLATTAFVQMLAASRRIQARQAMDATVKTVAERMSRELAGMHPCTAVWLRAKTGAGVEFVFTTSLPAPTSLPRGTVDNGSRLSPFRQGFSSTVWSRWSWDKAAQILYVSDSSPMRLYLREVGRWPWAAPGAVWAKTGWGFNAFLSLPQPRAETGPFVGAAPSNDLEAVLGDNRWIAAAASRDASRDARDIDDYADLLQRQRPIAYRCSALSLALKPLDVHAPWVVADGSADVDWACVGNLVDGRISGCPLGAPMPPIGVAPNIGYRQDQRPSIVRLTVTLAVPLRGANAGAATAGADPSDQVSSTYTFSFATPGLANY